ncbi:TM2 domain-containing protein [Gracilimonas tropica]|uniref:TM2 domain-containing protein n=1 Tax=Gracilimonas tropica TaxID=454600 RepID=UPI00037CB5C3|nr:TM2 domain-containing protein [Gracilimonas tropica]
MANVIDHLPEIEGDEMIYINKLLEGLNEEEAGKFTNVYRARRKDPQLILITCLLGFLGFAGIHRLIINQLGMGILYLFTGGLCVIGTVVDLVNYKDLAFQYNRQVAKEVLSYIK